MPVREVSEHTGFPEILEGRVKTLVPQVHGGILGKRNDPAHVAQMAEHKIAPIDLVAVNLYPFEATVARGAAFEDCIENIDIGGPAMIRSAAKNHESVAVLTEPEHYAKVLEELEAHGGTTLATRRQLAAAAYARTAAYDSAISGWFAQQNGVEYPESFTFSGVKKQELRYGENPHQSGGVLHLLPRALWRGHRHPAPGQGTLLQQLQRHRRRLRVRRGVRRPDRGDREARQPVRRGERPQPGRCLG